MSKEKSNRFRKYEAHAAFGGESIMAAVFPNRDRAPGAALIISTRDCRYNDPFLLLAMKGAVKQVKSLFSAFVFCGILALAQNSDQTIRIDAPAPDYTKLKAYLTLTDAQLTQLTTLQTNHANANRSLYEQMAAQHTILNNQLNSDSPDTAAAGNAVAQIASLRRQLRTAEEQHRTAAAAVLTEAQRPKLQQLDAASKLSPEIWQAQSLGLLEGYARILPVGLNSVVSSAAEFLPASR